MTRLTTAPTPWITMGPTASPQARSTRSVANCMVMPTDTQVTMVR